MKRSILKESKITQAASFLLVGSLALALSSLVASAQTGTGTITGTVRDQLVVVPLAEVTITNLDTDISHKESTSREGVYYFGALPPGSYTMRSEEHTSELQSRGHLVCRLLLEKKKISHTTCNS